VIDDNLQCWQYLINYRRSNYNSNHSAFPRRLGVKIFDPW
jgi:hypothetical protein